MTPLIGELQNAFLFVCNSNRFKQYVHTCILVYKLRHRYQRDYVDHISAHAHPLGSSHTQLIFFGSE